MRTKPEEIIVDYIDGEYRVVVVRLYPSGMYNAKILKQGQIIANVRAAHDGIQVAIKAATYFCQL